MRIILSLILFMVILSCSNNSGPVPQKWLVGINDSAIYHLGKDGRAMAVQKSEYSHPGEYILIHRDTVDLGDLFRATFSLSEVNYQIIISKPSRDTLTSEDKKKLPIETPLKYTFETTKKEILDFEGEIRYDSSTKPFKWKFIVI